MDTEKFFKCSEMDTEFVECEFTASGDEEVVLEKAKDHLLTMHDFNEDDMTPELEDKIRTTMTEEDNSMIPPDESEQI